MLISADGGADPSSSENRSRNAGAPRKRPSAARLRVNGWLRAPGTCPALVSSGSMRGLRSARWRGHRPARRRAGRAVPRHHRRTHGRRDPAWRESCAAPRRWRSPTAAGARRATRRAHRRVPPRSRARASAAATTAAPHTRPSLRRRRRPGCRHRCRAGRAYWRARAGPATGGARSTACAARTGRDRGVRRAHPECARARSSRHRRPDRRGRNGSSRRCATSGRSGGRRACRCRRRSW